MQGGVRKKGNRWYYYFDTATVDGKRKRIERAGGSTKKEAQEKLRQAIQDYEGTGDVRKDSSLSYSDYLNFWQKNYVAVNCKKGTQQAYKRDIDNHIKPTLGNYKLKALTPTLLQDFINSKSINGFNKNTVANFYGILSGSLKYAVYPSQLLRENPMQYVKMPKFSTVVDSADNKLKIISLENYKKIIERFPKGSSFYIPISIAFNTGLRAGEVCALTWNDIDFEVNTLTVNKTQILINGHFEIDTPKTNSSIRTIHIGDTLVNILKDHKEQQNINRKKYKEYYTESNLICTKENGDPITTNSLKYLSRVVNYELRIPYNFHSFRHTHATMLIEAGANMKDVQQRLGHSKLATTMDTYAHVTTKMSKSTVDIFEKINKKIDK